MEQQYILSDSVDALATEETYEHEDEKYVEDTNGVTFVNNEQNDFEGAGPEHMENMGAGVIEGNTAINTDVHDIVYEEYDVGDTVVSSSDHAYSFEIDQEGNLVHQATEVRTGTHQVKTTEKEKFNVESLSYELQVGYRILSNMMSASNRCVNKLFLYPVDDSYPETSDYYEKIKEPMWMFKMKEKFENHEYNDLTDFMADFRLMIENCYRYNGPDNFVSKKAQKLETMMKQKVALLSRDLRDKIMGASNVDDEMLTSAGIRRRVRNPNLSSDDPSQQLLSKLRRDREMQEKVDRKQKVEDRKAMEQARVQDLQEWEDKILGPDVKEKIRTMWELPQIGLFVYLCMESLGLEEEVTQYQLERGIAMPRECSDFRRLMTCLLSTPHQRKSLKSFMPYHVWNSKLTLKIDYFYKMLSEKKGNQTQVCYKLGLDTRAFKMMGKTNPLLKKKFHELSYLKRVWILKNYCDFCMETQQYLQKTIDDIEAVRPLDVREVQLGSDGRGYRYINFPMFTGKDIRIYKHSKTPEPSIDSLGLADWSVESEKLSASSSRCSTPVNPKGGRSTETPSTSLRARALLQAAESNDASPLRDTSRSGSEAPENRLFQTPTSDNAESSTNGSKQNSVKKRKRSGLFSSKRKRLKKSTPMSKTDSCDMIEEEEDDGRLNTSDVLNQSGSGLDFSDNPHVPQSTMTTSSEKPLSNGDSSNTDNQNSNVSQKIPNSSSIADDSAQNKGDTGSQMKSKQQDSAYLSYDSDKSIKEEEKESLNAGDSVSVIKKNGEQSDSVLNKIKSEDNSKILTSKLKQEPSTNASQSTSETESAAEAKCSSLDAIKNETGDGQDIKAEIKPDSDDVKKISLDQNKVEVSSVKTEIKKEEEVEEEDTDEEDLPDVGRIELAAESMEDIRALMNKLSNPEPIKRGKRTYPGVMKPCEEELLANITTFYEELLKYEKSLQNARVSMQAKLRKEVESYVEPKVDEAKGWDSDHSQSSKDSSEDEEEAVKADAENARQSKRIKASSAKQAAATAALLSSAASKLSSISGDGNEDSNDSFELDISSRGRLRKRRIIPNNTEDTGLKKRKNLPNQESLFNSGATTAACVPITVAHLQQQPITVQSKSQAWQSHLISMLSSNQNSSVIRAQLANQNLASPGQVLSLMAPGPDGTMKTIRVTGKPNMVISPQNLSNFRFLSTTGVVTLPRNKVISSSAQTAHPVIQQLLLSQQSSTPSSASTTTVFSSNTSSVMSTTQNPKPNLQPNPNAVKVSLVITAPCGGNPLASSKPSYVMAPQSVVVTQVSTMTQGGKQVLDLGSLSMTQIQQLIKNQAIQINTGGGNPTTLLLTSNLQSLASSRALPTTLTPSLAAPVRIPNNLSPVQAKIIHPTGAQPSIVNIINKKPSVSAPQIIVNTRQNPMLTLSGQVPAQVIRPFTTQTSSVVRVAAPVVSSQISPVGNQELSVSQPNAPFVRAAPLATSLAGKVVLSPNFTNLGLRPANLRPTSTISMTTTQKPMPSPRIISSLNPAPTVRVTKAVTTLSLGNLPQQTAGASASPGDAARAKVITVPLMNVSPAKKYAGNVTVKALLENRGFKKIGDEDYEPNQTGGLLSSSGVEAASPGEKTSADNQDISVSSSCEESKENSKNFNTSTIIRTLQCNRTESDFASMSEISSSSLPLSTLSILNAHTNPLSIDTGMQCRAAATSSEVIVPTVNIKVPSPNTLPSVLHNKNGTTIVQSTKVPIPVATETKTGDSLSPVSLTSSTSQVSTLQSINALSKAHSLASNNMVITAVSNSVAPSTIKLVSSGLNTQQVASPVASMKNVMLKVTPQSGGSGQFVQGFMTSRGLVIPQSALLQQQTGGNVILNTVSQPAGITQLQTNQLSQLQPSTVLSAGNQTSTYGQHGIVITQQLHQQPAQQLIVATPNSSSSLATQTTSPGFKVMFLNSSVSTTPSSLTSNSIITSGQHLATSTPASELVKQIANNSHLQASSQQRITLSAGSSQQNASQLLNSIVQGSPVQGNNMGQQASVSPQVAAQILALQQKNQMQQQNIVLAAKPNQVQNKPSVVALQLPQLGQLINLGGVTQLHLPQQLTTIQPQLASRVGQSGQVLQLAINPQTGNQAIIATQNPQVVRVGGQLSPQMQLANQNVAQMQPQGNIVLQQQQQPTQNIIVQPQQANLSVLGSGVNLQHSGVNQNLSALQQQLSKTSPLSTTKVQTPVGNQSTTSLVLSQLQSPSLGASSVNQFQYVLNPSSQPGLTLGSVSLNKVSAGSLTGTVNRVIRADSNLLQSNLNSQNTLQGMVPSMSQSSSAVIVGNPQSKAQMIVPSSSAGQYLISPVKLAPQQANMISPIKFINALPSPNSVAGQNSSQFVINNSALAGGSSQGLAKPSVIFASGQSSNVVDKKEGKIAQILLSQPIASINANQPHITSQTTTQLPVSLGVGSKPGSENSKTYLYKIGDQYYSPTTNISVPSIQQMTSGTMSTSAKTDVQLFVPPACIEASDQILKQNNTLFTTNLNSNMASTSSLSQNLIASRPTGRESSTTGSVNGIHNGNAQFSFSLSGPSTLGTKPAFNGQTSVVRTQQSGGASVLMLNSSNGVLDSESRQVNAGEKQYSLKGAPQHGSATNTNLTVQEQNEKEAALNLLTLANQPI
ncbi:uncharacterized protein KIAA2026-like isoform X2 [Physella acuta]|uniref:uncharacterized protein KIAA2026-like isoform X2 n=1 Tax=Physella acuta TaxID=109671 RepID=UPI0027DE05FA|nr:uncharacterized protein KIAA2026-like isoform X2 [Physella acuta]